MITQSTHQCLGILLVSSHINKSDNLCTILNNFRHSQKLRQICHLAIRVETHNVMIYFRGFPMNNFLDVLMHVLSGQTLPIVFSARNQYTNQCALATGFAAKHCNFDALFHVAENVAIES